MDLINTSGLSHLVEAASALSKLVEVGDEKQDSACNCRLTQEPNLVVSDDEDDPKPTAKLTPVSLKDIFPQRLMEILKGPYSDVISWLPHGRSFIIIRPDVFSEEVLPQFFPTTDSRSSTKYSSFTRKLNRWGFRQATRGPDTGAFHHPFFRRDEPDLCLDMTCQKSRKKQAVPSSERSKKTVGSTAPTSALPSTSNKPQQSNQMLTALTKESLATLPTSELKYHNKTVSLDSADERSLSPGPSSDIVQKTTRTTTTTSPQPQLHQFTYRHPVVSQPSPFLPSDPSLVAKALRDLEEREKLTVAKSLLYQAYLDAIKR